MLLKIQKIRNTKAPSQIVKDNVLKPTTKITLKSEKNECFPSKIRKHARVSALTILVQHGAKNSSHCSKARKKNKKNVEQKGRQKSPPIYR
jgi:hypothetical protein